MSDGLFDPIFLPDELLEAVGDRAWLQAMLDAEAALVAAQAGSGLVSTEDADAISACCEAERFDARAGVRLLLSRHYNLGLTTAWSLCFQSRSKERAGG